MTHAPTRRRTRTRAGALLLAAALGLAACGGGSDGGSSSDEVGTDDTSSDAGSSSTSPPASIDTTGLPRLDQFTIDLQEVVTADQPVALVGRSGYTQLYVAERTGRVREITVTEKKDKNGNVTSRTYKLEKTAVLDLSDEITDEGQEQGLLGIVFSPDGRKLYVDYTNEDGDTRVVEYSMSDRRADAKSAQTLLEIDQPHDNHNGGSLVYGPDGFLYVGMGDGGSQGDPDGNGQDTDTLLAKILRIDPDAAKDDRPYGIPPGNPFIDGGGLPEIWLYGVRNPWRFSFDSATGDLWIGDVGGGLQEEIDWLPKTSLDPNPGRGANLGWDRVEGTVVADGDAPAGAVGPLFTYTHDEGDCSVTGGYVYRGAAVANMGGVYLFGDFCGGVIRGLVHKDGVLVEEGPLDESVPNLSSFGVDTNDELYVMSLDGPIFRIVAGPPPPPVTTTTVAPPPESETTVAPAG